MENYLQHHGILGQRWGERNGPPYPLSGGDYSNAEKREIFRQRLKKNSIYNKKHFDTVIKKKETLSTLSYDKNRTKDADMFYATHKVLDKHYYNAFFNRPIPKTIYDKDGNDIGTGSFLKYRIDNSARSDIKVASEDSGSKIFLDLYKNDRDFYNFVTDKERMQDYFVQDKFKFKGYREARDVLNKLDNPNYSPSSTDIKKLYRLFNYVLPYDGQGKDDRGAHDVANQRAKFFKILKQKGYGAVLDTNDAIYGGFKRESPVIVFDMGLVIPKKVYQTKMSDKNISTAIAIGMRALAL